MPYGDFLEHLLGGAAADEEPLPENNNPQPRPIEKFHHPNQDILVVPIPFHLA